MKINVQECIKTFCQIYLLGNHHNFILLQFFINLIQQSTFFKFDCQLNMQLPPNIQQLSTHQFGSFGITVTSINLSQQPLSVNHRDHQLMNIFTVCPIFLGIPYSCIDKFKYPINQTITFPIMTPAWYFYLYLTDMQTLVFKFNKNPSQQNQSTYTTKIALKLENSCQILRKEFCGQMPILKTNKYQAQIKDEKNIIKGTVKIQINVSFDVSLHKLIKNLMNFKDILVIEGISRIGAQMQDDDQVLQSPRPPPSISVVSDKIIQNISNSPKMFKNQQKKPFQLNYQKQSPQSGDDEKIVNDDIDRMIAELQYKTYDSSRYQENVYDNNKEKEFIPSKTVFIQKNIPTAPPPFYRTNSMILPSHNSQAILQQQPHFFPKKHNALNQQAHHRSQSTGKNSNNLHNNHSNNNANIKLKIDEIFISGSSQEQNSNKYQLSMYANDNFKTQDKIFCLRKQRQGDIINFDHSMVIAPILSSNKPLKSLKFYLQQSPDIDYGEINEIQTKKLEGIFDISRLHSMPNKKGVFMVSFTYPQKQQKVTISKSNTRLNELPSIPKHFNLRIQLQVTEPPVQQSIIQIFSKISKIELFQHYKLDTVKYKIPYTKDQIEFSTKQISHWNIFPHTREYDEIILEFWNEGRLLGISLIDLKNIKNTNVYAVNASQEPIWLYDKDIKIMHLVDNNKIYGKFHLQLCFGTVRQMQKVLKGQLSPQSSKMPEKQKLEIRLDQKSGIYIKQKKQNICAEVQVNIETQHQTSNSKKYQNQTLEEHSIPIDKQYDRKTNLQNSSRYKYSRQQHFQSQEEQQSNHEDNIDEYEDIIRHCKQTTIKKPEQIIPPKSITETLQKRISKLLEKLAKSEIINQLKSRLKPHTLYNFIDVHKLSEVLENLGIKKMTVKEIIEQILLPCNDMVNVNILYDFLASLSINNTIKSTLIPANVLGKYCLRLLYQQSSQNLPSISQDFQFNQLRQIMLKTPIKSEFYDRGVKKLNYKLTMHQYNNIISYIQWIAKQKKQTPDQIKQNIEALISRDMMIMEIQKDEEEEVQRLLYGQLDSSQYSQNQNQFLSANQSHTIVTDTKQSKISQKSIYSHPQKNSKLTERQQQLKQTSWNFKKNEEIKIQEVQNRFIYYFKISGLETCKNSAESLLDRQFPNAKIKVKIAQPFQSIFQFNNDNEQQFSAAEDIEQLVGTVWLENKQEQIAISNFNIIEDINSVYVLKHNEDFCGLVNISFNKQQSQ